MGGGDVRSLPVEMLVEILGHIDARERHASAAWVLPSWRDACVVLALRDRANFQPGAEGATPHPPLPLTAAVGERVRAAMKKIEPGCSHEDWVDGQWNRWDVTRPAACEPCRGQSVTTRSWVDIAPGELVTSVDEPLLFTGLTTSRRWDAHTAWRLDSLYLSSEHADAEFAVGKEERGPNAGSPVRVALKDYLQYILAQQDSDPLYLFESDFVEQCPRMVHEYAVPTDHIDDDILAWNVCVHGAKRWVFVHPSVQTADVVGDSRHYEEHRPVLSWFEETVPSLLDKHPGKVFECMQPAGSLIHVPKNWWHAVWNVEASVAVTHNYIARGSFNETWAEAVAAARDANEQDIEEFCAKYVSNHFGFTDLPAVRDWCRVVTSYDLV